jgi:hypothetical protein
MQASRCKTKNRVKELARADGSITSSEGEMGNLANAFYQQLYTSEGVSGMDEVLQHVPARVDRMMNKLDAPFSESEVTKALFEMYPTKSSVQMVFPHIFFPAALGVGRN